MRSGVSLKSRAASRSAICADEKEVTVGDINQIIYAKRIFPAPTGSVLEIGSKDYGSTSSLRGIYDRADAYTGTDLEEGANVDVVCDLDKGTEGLAEESFDLALCFSVLEHVARPWIVAENIGRLIKPGGHLCLSVPWVWRYHPYPDDYYRYSPSAIKVLFPDFEFFDIQLSTMEENDFWPWNPEEKKKGDVARVITSGDGKKKNYLPYMNLYMAGLKNPRGHDAGGAS